MKGVVFAVLAVSAAVFLSACGSSAQNLPVPPLPFKMDELGVISETATQVHLKLFERYATRVSAALAEVIQFPFA